MDDNNFEGKIYKAAQKVMDKINYPEPECFCNAPKRNKVRRLSYPLKRVILIACVFIFFIALSGITVAAISGYNIIDYFFGDPAFKEVQEQGQINITNMIAEKDGIKVELRAVFSDYNSTYISISAFGTTLEEIKPGKGVFINGTEGGNWLFNRIKDVYISNENGINWNLKSHIPRDSESGPVENGTKNDAILAFDISPKADTEVNIKVEFINGTAIEFKQVALKVIPNQYRDLSDKNIAIEFENTIGRVKGISYSAFKTTLVIDWEFGYMKAEEYGDLTYDLKFKHTVLLAIGNAEFPINIISNFGTNDVGSGYTESYDFNTQATPKDTIEIRVYDYAVTETSGPLDYILLTIPGETDTSDFDSN